MGRGKPWKVEKRGTELEAYLGSRGIRTSQFETTEDLIAAARSVFQVIGNSCDEVADAVSRLSKGERARLASKNGQLFSDFAPAATGNGGKQETQPRGVVDGGPFGFPGSLDLDAEKLLKKVVGKLISTGNAGLLNEFPDVLAYFGGRLPERPGPTAAMIEAGVNATAAGGSMRELVARVFEAMLLERDRASSR